MSAATKSHTYRPTKTQHSASVEVHADCVGMIIGKGGKNIKSIVAAHPGIKIQGPRRGNSRQIFRVSGPEGAIVHAAVEVIRDIMAKWEKGNSYRQQHDQDISRRKQMAQKEWENHIQDISGCKGDGWSTTGSAASNKWQEAQLAKQKSTVSYTRRPVNSGNRYDIPSSSEDEEEENEDVPIIVTPKKLPGTNAWSKGAPKLVTKSAPETKEQKSDKTWEDIKANALSKKGTSWADMCDSDDEENK